MDAARRLRALTTATTALSVGTDPRRALDDLVRAVIGDVADGCAIDVLRDRGVERIVSGGAIDDAPSPAPASLQLDDRRIAAPLHGRDAALGALVLVRDAAAPCFDAEDVRVAAALAAIAATVVARVRAAEEARVSGEHPTGAPSASSPTSTPPSSATPPWSATLAEASSILASTPFAEKDTMRGIARILANVLGDACVITLADRQSGALEVVATHHRDPSAIDDMRGILEPGKAGLVRRVFEEGRLVRVRSIDGAALASGATAGTRAYLERRGVSSLMLAPLRIQGETIGIIGVTRDRGGLEYTASDESFFRELAERAAIAIHNARLYEQARVAIALRDDFLVVAGHELKTPLTALQLELGAALRRASARASADDLVPRLRRAAAHTKRLALLVDELLDVTRLENDSVVTLVRRDVDLRALVMRVLEAARDELARRGCTVRIVADREVHGRWDADRLEQVVLHLLTNAMKYGRGQPICVSVERDGDVARVTVSDEGMGIPEEEMQRIFDRFARAVSSQHFGGLGLGLWIARRLVELHGGTIQAQNEPLRGARFTVALPIDGATALRDAG